MGQDKRKGGKAFPLSKHFEQKGLCTPAQCLASSKWLEVGFGVLGNLWRVLVIAHYRKGCSAGALCSI